jgi:hypothetical protein
MKPHAVGRDWPPATASIQSARRSASYVRRQGSLKRHAPRGCRTSPETTSQFESNSSLSIRGNWYPKIPISSICPVLLVNFIAAPTLAADPLSKPLSRVSFLTAEHQGAYLTERIIWRRSSPCTCASGSRRPPLSSSPSTRAPTPPPLPPPRRVMPPASRSSGRRGSVASVEHRQRGGAIPDMIDYRAFFVMSGLVPGIHVLATGTVAKTWMAGTSPAMTDEPSQRNRNRSKTGVS